MHRKKRPYAEDILAGDNNFTGNVVPEQQKLAGDIKKLICVSGHEKLSERDRELLWDRIKGDVRPAVPRISLYLKAAAVFLIILGTGLWWSYKNSYSNLLSAASKVKSLRPSADIQIILANKRILTVGEKSTVVYKKNGKITLDNFGVALNKPGREESGSFHILVVPYGRHAFITLSDGTKIWINSGSKLVYPADFPIGRRDVYLTGEAYFDVAHAKERPFYVHTDDTKIKVLGTEFNVSSYAEEKRESTVLVKGSIELTSGNWLDRERKQLNPGELAIYDPAKKDITVTAVSPEAYISWKEGYLSLEHASLPSILKKLSRYYNINIKADQQDVNDEYFSGRLDLQKNITDVMEVICAGTSLAYKPKERRLVRK